MPTGDIKEARVAAVFDAYPRTVRARLLGLRRLIFETARRTEGVGQLEETLKWGQPSYLTAETGSGTTVRIDQVKGSDTRYAVYFHCQTGLVDTFRELYRDRLRFEGNRSIVLETAEALPAAELGHCIALAFTYHRDKRAAKRQR